MTTVRETQQPASVPAAHVMQVHRCLGLRVLDAREWLRQLPPDHYARVMVALESQPGPTYYDPLEDDPQYAPLIDDAARDAGVQVDAHLEETRADYLAAGRPIPDFFRGQCHLAWHLTKAILRERHGIDWLTPAEMNPGCRFD